MKRKFKIIGVCAILFVGFLLLIVGLNYHNLYESKWVCVAQKCDVWATGDDWVTDNCRPEDNDLICEITFDSGEHAYTSLKNLNTSALKSCREYVCVTEVLIKEHKEDKNE